MKSTLIRFFFLMVFVLVSSCEMEPTLADQLDTQIKSDKNIRSFLDGTYRQMVNFRYYGRNMILAGELRSDNTYSNGNSGRMTVMSRMQLTPTTGDVGDLFNQIYGTVANPNIIIQEYLSGNEIEGEQNNIEHMIGEAYGIRAQSHFDLLRLFGQQYIDEGENLGVSYITEFKGDDVQIPRGTVEENKSQIYADITAAIDHLKEGQSSQYSQDKTNFTLDAAYALLTRVAVYFKDYATLLAYKDEVEDLIARLPVTEASELVEYWAQSTPGKASIFELSQSESDNQNIDGISYIYRGNNYGDVQAYDSLIQDAEFEPGDIRISEEMMQIDDRGILRNMGKYPSEGQQLGSDNIIVYRIEEVVLNYAEALEETGQQSNTGKSASDYLNMITSHRNASPYTSSVDMDDILKERRKELLFEGFRFFDLQRTGRDIPNVDPSTVNNHELVPAGDYRFAMPIPRREIEANKQTKQNPHY